VTSHWKRRLEDGRDALATRRRFVLSSANTRVEGQRTETLARWRPGRL